MGNNGDDIRGSSPGRIYLIEITECEVKCDREGEGHLHA